MNYRICETDFGPVYVGEENNKIVRIKFQPFVKEENAAEKETPLLKKAVKELGEYFIGKRKIFTVPIAFHGTDFQEKVWQALLEIPYGMVASYKDIAVKVGSPKAYRAVGMANHRNPISIIVPCHRVIAHDGTIGGYGGGVYLKEKLLQLEEKNA